MNKPKRITTATNINIHRVEYLPISVEALPSNCGSGYRLRLMCDSEEDQNLPDVVLYISREHAMVVAEQLQEASDDLARLARNTERTEQ